MGMVKRKIGDILTLQRGYDLPASKMEGGNVAVVGSNGIIGYHNIVKYDAPCIIVGRSGSVGKVRYYSIPTWPHNTALFVKDFKGNDPLYLYYFLKNLHLDEKFSKSSSVVPSLDRNIVHSLHVQFQEDINEQKNIAKILSAFDIKIALNRQINDNLEAMARQLYDYWFVQFDFSDENGRPYKSSGGKMVWNEKLKQNIPMGWIVEDISKIADVYNGATPSTKEERNYGGNIVWITPKDLSDQKSKFVYYGERNITQKGYDSCSTHMLPIGTVLMSSRAPIGLLSIAKSELCTNQGFKSFVPKKETLGSYLYYYILLHIKQIEQLGTGTTFKEISRDDVMTYPILVPKEELLNKWAEFVFPIDNRQFEIQQENKKLTKQRDELLPLLMNGQVSVNYHLSFGILFVYLFLYSQNMKYIWQQKIY